MRGDKYQISLIALSVVVIGMFSLFVYRELFPEYKIYQNAYVALEEFRAEKMGLPVPPFTSKVEQVVIPADDRGPETVDRCVSCHVALKLEHFSPTKIAKDINGQIILDENGTPKKVPNDEYVWAQVEEVISHLRDPAINDTLSASELATRLAKADELEALKHVEVEEHHYDMSKVLAMHPLIGKETRPFESHPVEEFGCTSCHSGNGRSVVTDRAHGPVFDGKYEEAHMGPEPVFVEHDDRNDPLFAKAYNHKPGHRLLFQTKPLLVGGVMEAKCVQCHQTTKNDLNGVLASVESLASRKQKQAQAIADSVEGDKEALVSLIETRRKLEELGLQPSIEFFAAEQQDFTRPPKRRAQLEYRVDYLTSARESGLDTQQIADRLKGDMILIMGSENLADELERSLASSKNLKDGVDQFFASKQDQSLSSIFAKKEKVIGTQEALERLSRVSTPIQSATENREFLQAIAVDTDRMTKSYQRGEELFLASACYACHKIEGLSRGGVGPELTEIGLFYPWYVKESIVWPQGNLPSSTMPNFKLDTEEVADLMTFLMAQRKDDQTIAQYARQVQLKEWEAGKQRSWEAAVPPAKVRDTKQAMMVFATEGCSACHKLKGFDSQVGFASEASGADKEAVWQDQEWFEKRFPEEIAGSIIVKNLEKYADEIEARLLPNASEPGFLEHLESQYPRLTEALYTNFKYAARAKDTELAHDAKALAAWKEKVHRVLMAYIEHYGLGRSIAPKLHWAGVYRDTEWLVGHFRNPAAHNAKSIMPVLPFDDTKFYALTYMLQELGQQNRDEAREVWDARGFDPQRAFDLHCASCHGQFMAGNGPVARWIYPIPKNLRNATFLRNLTRERAAQSILHGVTGGPMPPWGESYNGEAPVLNEDEVAQLVDWLFQSLPGGQVIKGVEDVKKWNYKPEDIIEDLQREGDSDALQFDTLQSLLGVPGGDEFYVSLEPKVYQKKNEQPLHVGDLFEVRESPIEGAAEDKWYYIKKEFYTPYNISEGQRLFIANCSHCHGKEGAGNGDRATAMQDAKPRMLSNLPWLRTRDDLRLLRSLKYGVPGTSMTPWGDKTSTLQRIQIVAFIRTISAERKQREDLVSALFQSFESSRIAVEGARAKSSAETLKVQERLAAVRDRRESLYTQVQGGELDAQTAAQAYSEELALLQKQGSLNSDDQSLVALVTEMQTGEQILEKLGKSFVAKQVSPAVFEAYLDYIKLSGGLFSLSKQGGLQRASQVQDAAIRAKGREVLEGIEKILADLKGKVEVEEARLRSPEREASLKDLKEMLMAYEDLRGRLISAIEETSRNRQRQIELFQKLNGSGAVGKDTSLLPVHPVVRPNVA